MWEPWEHRGPSESQRRWKPHWLCHSVWVPHHICGTEYSLQGQFWCFVYLLCLVLGNNIFLCMIQSLKCLPKISRPEGEFFFLRSRARWTIGCTYPSFMFTLLFFLSFSFPACKGTSPALESCLLYNSLSSRGHGNRSCAQCRQRCFYAWKKERKKKSTSYFSEIGF